MHVLLLAVAAAHAGGSGVIAATLPYWTAPAFDSAAPLAGIPLLANASHAGVFFGSLEKGDYNHGVMLHYADGIVHLSWKNGVGGLSEDQAGQVRRWRSGAAGTAGKHLR